MKALAYLNWGRWVADCPVGGCTDARAIYPTDANGQPTGGPPILDHVCTGGHRFAVDMPPPEFEAQIVAALSERVSEKRRNWFPRGHPFAVLTGQPHGQTVRELREEAAAGEEADAQHLSDRRARILDEVRAAGFDLDVVLAALKGS